MTGITTIPWSADRDSLWNLREGPCGPFRPRGSISYWAQESDLLEQANIELDWLYMAIFETMKRVNLLRQVTKTDFLLNSNVQDRQG